MFKVLLEVNYVYDCSTIPVWALKHILLAQLSYLECLIKFSSKFDSEHQQS